MTLKTLSALGRVPDVGLVAEHPAIVLIPIAALAFCIAVATTVIAIFALEIFGQIDAQIPFVYFQF